MNKSIFKRVLATMLAVLLVVGLCPESHVLAGTYVSLDETKYYTDATTISGTMPTSSSYTQDYDEVEVVYTPSSGTENKYPPINSSNGEWSYNVPGLKAGTIVGVYFYPHYEVYPEVTVTNETTPGSDTVNNGETVFVTVVLRNDSDFDADVENIKIILDGEAYYLTDISDVRVDGNPLYLSSNDYSYSQSQGQISYRNNQRIRYWWQVTYTFYAIYNGSSSTTTDNLEWIYMEYNVDEVSEEEEAIVYPLITYDANYVGAPEPVVSRDSTKVGLLAPYTFNHTVLSYAATNFANDNTGYTFIGWNTQEDGGGTPYYYNDTITITDNVTLYAQWAKDYKVTYNANGGTGSDEDTVKYNVEIGAYDSYTIKSYTTAGISRTGYTFMEWNTQADGNGTPYSAGDTLTLGGDITLYAQWEANPHTVTYNANGGSGSHVDNVNYDDEYRVKSYADAGISYADYVFVGWNTQADGKGTAYATDYNFSITGDLTLYAQWEHVSDEYIVVYHANGGTGSHTDTKLDEGTVYTVKSQGDTEIYRVGYTFTSWNTQADGNGTRYIPGSNFTITGNAALYAQWTLKPSDGGGDDDPETESTSPSVSATPSESESEDTSSSAPPSESESEDTSSSASPCESESGITSSSTPPSESDNRPDADNSTEDIIVLGTTNPKNKGLTAVQIDETTYMIYDNYGTPLGIISVPVGMNIDDIDILDNLASLGSIIPSEEAATDNPKTGDDSTGKLMAIVILSSALMVIVVRRKKIAS